MIKPWRAVYPQITVGLCLILISVAVALAGETATASADAGAVVKPVKVNRTTPKVEPPKTGLEFSAKPTVQEIFRTRVFEEPLVPIGGEPGADENAALAAALLGYSKRSGPDDFASLTGFLGKHPQSPWRAALLTDLGLEYYNTAHYSLALEAWEKAWQGFVAADVRRLKLQAPETAQTKDQSLLTSAHMKSEVKTKFPRSESQGVLLLTSQDDRSKVA